MGKQTLRLLREAQRGYCAGCGGQTLPVGSVPDNPMDGLSEDHVDPKALGGSNDIRNKVAMHVRCNNAKGDTPPTGCHIIWRMVANTGLDLYMDELVKATRDPRGSRDPCRRVAKGACGLTPFAI